MKVVRVHGGTTFHVVHETRTHTRRATAFLIHGSEEVAVAEMRDGLPTCKRCLELDNPLALSVHEKLVIDRIARTGDIQHYKPQSVAHLINLDLLTEAKQFTRRGLILARDFTEGTAPWWDDAGIAHLRMPLEHYTKCAHAGVTNHMATFDKLTIERYDKLRRVGGTVTCLACLRVAR